MDSSTLLRLSLGFVVSPAVGLLMLSLFWCATAHTSFSSCWAGGAAILMVGGLGAVFAYPIAALVGIPLFVIFRKRRWLQWWQVSAGGLFVAILAVAGFALYTQDLLEALDYLALCSIVGLTSGLAFWAIAVHRNRALTLVGANANPA